MRVFKYLLRVSGDLVVLRMPKGARILTVHSQRELSGRNGLCIWALVDPGQTILERRTFRVAATGHEVADIQNKRFIGTVFLYSGSIVFHIFEELGEFAADDSASPV